MNLPAELLNVFDSLKVDPDNLSRHKANLYVQCGSNENAELLMSKINLLYKASKMGDEVRILDVVQ